MTRWGQASASAGRERDHESEMGEERFAFPSSSRSTQPPPPTAGPSAANADELQDTDAPDWAAAQALIRQGQTSLPSSHLEGTHSAPLASIIHTPTRSADTSGTLSPTPPQHYHSMHQSTDEAPPSASRPDADPERKQRTEERKKRRVQWARAPEDEERNGEPRERGLGRVIEEGPDAQEHREARQRRTEEDERLARELDERGLNKNAFRALRTALQTHQRSQLLGEDATSPTAVHDQLDVYVPSDQTFGLPAPEPATTTAGERDPEKAGAEPSAGGKWAFVRAAHKLVRGAHERRDQTPGERPVPRPLQPPNGQPPSGESSEEPSPLKPVDTGFSTSSNVPNLNLQGRGVLASLLAMYEQQNGGFSSGVSSVSTSAPSTPSTSDEESLREGRRLLGPAEREEAREAREANGWSRVERVKEGKSEPVTVLESSPPNGPKLAHAESDPTAVQRKNKTAGQSFANLWKSMSPRPASPPPTLGGAGVLGSLIATTGNLSGAAAPAPSTLAPQIGRSGFHLARYDMHGEPQDIDVEEERRRMKEERRKSWASIGWATGEGPNGGSRPSSRAGSRPASRRGSIEELKMNKLDSSESSLEEKSAGIVDPEYTASPRPVDDLSLSRASTINALSRVSTGPVNPLSRATTDSSDMSGTPREMKRSAWPGMLSLPKLTMSRMSREGTPDEFTKHKNGSYFAFKHRAPTPEEEEKLEAERKKEAERRRRKKQKKRRLEKEIFITMHVAAVLQRQEFLLKLARALMMFGAPTHRLEALIQATGRVLDMNVSCVHLPGLMLLSFNDDTTRTSETKFLKQPQALDLEKLQDVHGVYNAVIHDQTGVKDASDRLDEIMRAKSRYRNLVAIIIGGLCSAFITPISFSGSFLDAVLAFPLGCLLVLIQQVASKNELFTHVFEIVVALLLSFISAALASTNKVCYAAVASGSIVLILPGFIVLTGALELASRNIISGSVRLIYSVIYSLFLGFGLAIGGEFYTAITGRQVIGLGLNSGDTCPVHDPNGPWWQQQASPWWAFLCVPGFSFALSLRNQAPWNRKEFAVMILIACAGWTTNHFSGLKFVNRTDIVATLGAFVVGVCGNVYGRFFSSGMSFVVMVTGVLFQVPSSINGLLSFASLANSGGDSYTAGFSIAEQLIEVSIGLTVGLFLAAVITHPIESRRRGYGLFSF